MLPRRSRVVPNEAPGSTSRGARFSHAIASWRACKLPPNEKICRFQRALLIGAPRFELGTSSPLRGVAGHVGGWREVASLSRSPPPLRIPQRTRFCTFMGRAWTTYSPGSGNFASDPGNSRGRPTNRQYVYGSNQTGSFAGRGSHGHLPGRVFFATTCARESSPRTSVTFAFDSHYFTQEAASDGSGFPFLRLAVTNGLDRRAPRACIVSSPSKPHTRTPGASGA
jgi:hypothetical protein